MWKQGDKKIKNKVNSASNTKTTSVAQTLNKRLASQTSDETTSPCKMPKRAVACSNSKKKSVYMSKKSSVIETKRNLHVEEEIEALHLTAGGEDGRPCRRLTDFTFNDADGKQQPFEMLEVDDIYVSGRILPLEKSANKEKEQGVKCEGFGRIENWAISGYEEGYPVIWLSTDIADYDCIKPSSSYKMFYDHFFAKASACVEVYKKLTSSRGNPSLTLDELLAAVVRALTGQKCFSSVASIKDFILSQGEFIFKQLIGLDETSKKSDEKFIELPVLAALRNESYKHEDLTHAQPRSSTGILKIGPELSDTGNKMMQSGSSNCPEEHDEDLKLARLLNEEEYWHLMKQKKKKASTSLSTKFYIKINEDEIVDDYPLPAYYKTSNQETDEYVIFDSSIDKCHIDDLPRSMLHNWALYNADLRLISLELLPMKPCADIDVTIFGSGVMTADDGSGYNFDTDNNHSSSRGFGTSEVDGIPIYLSAIKEWMIEFGSSMVFISIRTDMAWYRLGKPSKQYAPWYDPVLKTARLAVNIITLLKQQRRVARLSFEDVIKRVSEFEKNHAAYISSSLDIVERYLVVHGQIIHQQFSEFPDETIRRCAFVTGLTKKMEERHHTKWLVKKKKVLLRNEPNLNPRASAAPVMSKRKVMRATTTMLINRIWGGYYSNHSLEESNEGTVCEVEEADELEEQDGNDEDDVSEENLVVQENIDTPCSEPLQINSCWKSKEIKWEGEPVGKTFSGEALYRRATVHGDEIVVGGAVLVQVDQSDKFPYIYFLEYMYEKMDGTKMFHGRMMLRGSQTVLGNAANERELFLTNECMDFELEDAKQAITAEIRVLRFGHQHRKANADADKIDRVRAEERKRKGLPTEFYCKCLYWPDRGAFFSLPFDEMGLGSGICHSCKLKGTNNKKERIEVNPSMISFVSEGTEYFLDDFIYVSPTHFSAERVEGGRFKSGRNVGLKAFVICQLLEIIVPKEAKLAEISSTRINVRRFFRPEDISAEKAYSSDIREIYYSEETHTIPVVAIEGKCEVKKKNDVPCQQESPAILDHIFFCEHLYDPAGGSLKQLPAHIKLKYSSGKLEDDDALRKKKGKRSEGENDSGVKTRHEASQGKPLATLDIFAGCGGLSEGLQLSGVSITKWAIEYDEAAGDAFKLNHPGSSVFINNCNVILRAVMQKCGDGDDCVSTPEAVEQSSSLCEEEVDNLPLPGQVDFINGGPPCQGFSRMNRFNHSTWSKVQCEMILAFLSFADYYRPKFFLLENVRTFVSFNHGETFRLTLASLLEMGYQVRFGVLEAGAYGVPQSRKRAFIWAASPEESLPEWPEPMHVFAAPELKIRLSQNVYYAAVRSTATGAAFKSLTVRDTIGDLPAVGNGASKVSLLYQDDPISWFQRKIRGNMQELSDHISKEMCELNVIRCQRIPKCPGADWRDLPDEKVKLSTGQVVDLIPWCLPNTAKRHNQWKGLFGRLDWEGNFPTSITDPQPMGKVGMCFHPEQDRIVTVRECARSQGFQDSYQFAGNVLQKHRQIGNAVPPPLAYALGMKLKEAIKSRNQSKSK